MCTWLLSLKPLALKSIYLRFYSDTVAFSHQVLKSVAHNDDLHVHNLTLVDDNTGSSHPTALLSEEILKLMFSRPLLRSLTLDLKCQPSDVVVIAKALRTQIQLGTLEKLRVTFCKYMTLERCCDLELLIDTVFNLPQISQFSFSTDMRQTDLQIVETLHKYWQSKKPKELFIGHFPGLLITEPVQSLIEEMGLSISKERCNILDRPCCNFAEHWSIHS